MTFFTIKPVCTLISSTNYAYVICSFLLCIFFVRLIWSPFYLFILFFLILKIITRNPHLVTFKSFSAKNGSEISRLYDGFGCPHYPAYHLWRKVIKPWEGSYGETLTSTRSPTSTLIRNFFIRPERRPLTVMSLSQ
jgi:hypothetical protein